MTYTSGKIIFAAALLAGTFLPATAALAQTRTWVSGVGDDVNPCSRTAPCKTFAGAISKTADKGEINCLDSAGYGALTITKNITIDCPGVMAGVLTSNTNGFTINAAGIVVTLRNLTFDDVGTTLGSAIRIVAAAEVTIDNVTIENFAGTTGTDGRGIAIDTAADIAVRVQNSRINNNGNIAIHANPSAGTVTLNVDNTQISHNGTTCVDLRQNTNATISRSSMTDCVGGAGVTAELSTVTAQVNNSIIANNNVGIFAGNGGAPTVRIYGNVITGNTTNGLSIVAGQILSHGNNAIRGNGGNETPSGVSLGTQ